MVERWYVVEAYEGHDEDVALRLCAARLQAWRPVHVVRSTTRDRLSKSGRLARRVIKYPRFGRYVFLRADLDGETGSSLLRTVADMRHVVDFLRPGSQEPPSPVPDDLIAFYRRAKLPRPSAEEVARFAPGDTVRVTEGPFSGFRASVQDIDIKAGSVRILVSIFGGPTPLVIEVGHIELVEQGRRPPIKSMSKHRAGRSAREAKLCLQS
jgi:transcription antitermination factor NusG